MKITDRQIRLFTSAVFYAMISVCLAVSAPEAAGIVPTVLLSLATQLLTAVGSRQWNSLAFALTLIPAGAMAAGIAASQPPFGPSALLHGLAAALIVRLVNSLRRWPDSRPKTLHWLGAAVGMMTFAATAAVLL